jgi:hypothetical protein
MDLETFDETVAKTDEDPFFSQRSGNLRFGCRPHRRVEDLGMEIFPRDQQTPENYGYCGEHLNIARYGEAGKGAPNWRQMA